MSTVISEKEELKRLNEKDVILKTIASAKKQLETKNIPACLVYLNILETLVKDLKVS